MHSTESVYERLGFYVSRIASVEDCIGVLDTTLSTGTAFSVDDTLSDMNSTVLYWLSDNTRLAVTDLGAGDFPFSIDVMLSQQAIDQLEAKSLVVDLHIELASHLAMRLAQPVVTDLPNMHPDLRDPYCWLQVMPSGQMIQRREVIFHCSEKGKGGLVFDASKDVLL